MSWPPDLNRTPRDLDDAQLLISQLRAEVARRPVIRNIHETPPHTVKENGRIELAGAIVYTIEVETSIGRVQFKAATCVSTPDEHVAFQIFQNHRQVDICCTEVVTIKQHEWKKLALRLARHIRNTNGTEPIKWGVEGMALLEEVMNLDQIAWEEFVKSDNTVI